jgi:hypothetical protein
MRCVMRGSAELDAKRDPLIINKPVQVSHGRRDDCGPSRAK